MLTKWAKEIATVNMLGVGSSASIYFLDYSGSTKKFSSNLSSYNSLYKSMDEVITSTSSSSYGIVFGNGTTEPTETDFNISGSVLSGLTNTHSRSVSIDSVTGEITIKAIYTLTNTNSSDVTVSEVGLFGGVYYLTGSSNYTTSYLIDRTLLDEAITIPPNGVATVTLTYTPDILGNQSY